MKAQISEKTQTQTADERNTEKREAKVSGAEAAGG